MDMDIEPTTTRVAYRRPRLTVPIIVLLAIVNLVIGLIGGIGGFVLLSNSKSTAVTNLRQRLGLDGSSSLAIPIHQDIRVEESSAIIDASKKVSPAVVSISANQQVQDFFGNTSSQEVAGGTGFIITSDGLIVTNKHVVSLDAQYKVILSDGRIFDAKIQATDPLNDLRLMPRTCLRLN
jgi:S1-C subfamily serine protease